MSMSGDSYDILDQSGNLCFKVKGKFWSLSEQKTMYDGNEQALYRMSEKVMTMHARQRIVDAHSRETIVTIARKSIVPRRGLSTVLVWRGADTEAEPWLVCKGDLLRRKFFVEDKEADKTIAMITRGVFTKKNLLLSKSTYDAQFAPGVNVPLMLMVVVAIDETYAENRSAAASG